MSQDDAGQALDSLFLPFLNLARGRAIPGANEMIAIDSSISIPPSCPSEGNLYECLTHGGSGGWMTLAFPKFASIVPISWKTRHYTLLGINKEKAVHMQEHTYPHAPNTA